MSDTNCGVSFGEVQVSNLGFANDAALLAEFVDSLVDRLRKLSREANPLGLQVSWTKTKTQSFGGVLNSIIHLVPVQGENVEVIESFLDLGSVIWLCVVQA